MRNTLKKVMVSVLAVALLLGVLAVPPQDAQAAEITVVKSIKMKPGETFLLIGDQDGVDVSLDKNGRCSSSNPKVATVKLKKDPSFCCATIAAKKPGKAVITTTVKGKAFKTKVTVVAEKVSMTKKAKVKVGETVKISLQNNKKKARWKITKGKKLIKITKKSKTSATIKGLKKGTAKVQAVVGKKKYNCTVTVSVAKKKPTASSKPQAAKTPVPTSTPSEGTPATSVPTTTPSGGTPATSVPTSTPSAEGTPATSVPTSTPSGDVPVPTLSPDVPGLRTIVYDGTNGDEIYDADEPIAVTVKDGVTSIEEYAFCECSSLMSITIPDSVTEIGVSAFNGCSSLTSITIPDSVTEIGWAAFEGCSSLTSITIPESVTSIWRSVFNGCSSLTSITIPDSVTEIWGSAFQGCSSLTSITIPESVTYIVDSAFDGCSSLTSITWKGTDYNSVDSFETAFGGFTDI